MRDGISADPPVASESGPSSMGKKVNIDFFEKMLGEDVTNLDLGWRRKTHSKDEGLAVEITVHAKPVTGTKLQLTRTESLFESTNTDKFQAYLVDIEKNLKADSSIKEFKVITKHPDGTPAQFYWKMKMVGIPERDSVCSFETHELDDGQKLFVTKSIEHPEYPTNKKSIRLDLYTAGTCQQEGDNMRYIEFAFFDLKGWFPPRLFNLMIGTQAIKQVK
jgi:hypothetical protein